jgi:transposase
MLEQSRRAFTRWKRLSEGSIVRPMLRSYVGESRGVLGHLPREGEACGCPWTAKVCRKTLESEVPLRRFAEVRGEAPDNNAAERSLRHCVIWRKRKLKLGTESESCSRFVERLLPVLEICRQRERSGARFLTACFPTKSGGQPILPP